MRIRITQAHTMAEIEPYLFPVRQFCAEKRRKGMCDDWDEARHTTDWLEQVLADQQNGEPGELYVYYLEENGTITGAAFALLHSRITLDALAQAGVIPGDEQIAHLTCFHILEAYRRKGRDSAWLTGEIFGDLRAQGVDAVYIKSSHHPRSPSTQGSGRRSELHQRKR